MTVETQGKVNLLSRDEMKNTLKSLEISQEKDFYVHLNSGAMINGKAFSNFCVWQGMGGTYFVSVFDKTGNNRRPCIVHGQKKASGENLEEAVDNFFQGVSGMTDVSVYEK